MNPDEKIAIAYGVVIGLILGIFIGGFIASNGYIRFDSRPKVDYEIKVVDGVPDTTFIYKQAYQVA